MVFSPKDEAEKLLQAMDSDRRAQAVKALLAFNQARSDRELEIIVSTLPEEIQEFIALFSLGQLQNITLKKKQEKLKMDASILREDVVKILCAMIAAHPETEDLALVERSIAMAQRLHDSC